MQDVLAFLKSGRKAPAHFANLDKISTKKCLHTLSEFSRNFKYEGMALLNVPMQFDKYFMICILI